MDSNQRPLSPHLQIYRPQWSSVLSIMHRFTGVVLSAATVLMVVWLVALASGAQAYERVTAFMSHPLMLVVLVGCTLALFYHLLNGIRHLIWDAGMMLELEPARASGWFVAVASVALTAAVWLMGGVL